MSMSHVTRRARCGESGASNVKRQRDEGDAFEAALFSTVGVEEVAHRR